MVRDIKISRLAMVAGLFLAMLGACLSFVETGFAAALPPPTVLSMATSTHDSYARYQTISYVATLQKSGTLSYIVMTIPTGATVGTIRSSSGTVEYYKPGQIIWRPASPLKVTAGARLGIPVVGINFNQPGTTDMWLVAADAAGNNLAYARGDFTIDSSSVGTCPTTGNSYIQTENAKPGAPKSAWQISSASFNPTTFAGYANADSYKCGDLAYFKVDSKSSSYATAKVYRMGYYGGNGAREIWSTSDYFLTGKQPAPKIVNTATVQKMVDASNWNYNLAIRIDGRFTPGTYLVKMTDRVGHETYVPFTVRDDTGVKHDFLFQQGTTTWQAYNKYGGYSFYTGADGTSSHVTFNRPYAEDAGKGSGQYLQLENGLVWWMEKNNYDVAYWTDTDLNNRPNELSTRAKTLILPGHDEYYSTPMRNALVDIIGSSAVKTNLMSLGANQAYRTITFTSDKRTFEVNGKRTGGYTATTWRSHGPAYAEQNIMGAQYGCRSSGTITPNSAWIWRGVPAGTKLEGLANGETDYVNTYDSLYKYTVPKPAGNTVFTSAPLDSCAVASEPLRMDIVGRTTATGAQIFGGSSFAYGCFLDNSCYATWPGRTPGAFSVDQADSAAVGILMGNIFEWMRTGQVPSNL